MPSGCALGNQVSDLGVSGLDFIEPGYQTEAQLEAEFIRMLQAQGYEYLQIHHEDELKNNLRKQLEKLNNYDFSNAEWERLISD